MQGMARLIPAQIFKWYNNNTYGFIMTVIGVIAIVVYANSHINANACMSNTHNKINANELSMAQVNICRQRHGLSTLTREQVKDGKRYPSHLKHIH